MIVPRSRSYLEFDRTVEFLNEEIDGETVVTDFEMQFARYIDAREAIATVRARAGLLLLLKALSIGPGDEVVLQGFTYVGVPLTIRETGATTVLVDNSIADLNTTFDQIALGVSDRTRAIIVTHLFGIPSDLKEIVALGHERGIPVIEDCAQCLGPRYAGKRTGAIGDASIFSFNYEKHLTTGEGGILAINSPELIGPVRDVVAQYRRLSWRAEMCHVYGLLVQHITTDPEICPPDLIAYFGQNLCRDDPKTFETVDRLVQAGSHEEEMRTALRPVIKKRISGPPSLSARFPMLAPAFRFGFAMQERLRGGPQFPRTEAPELLMGPRQAQIGAFALESLDDVNRVRNEHASILHEAFDDDPSYLTTRAISPEATEAVLKFNLLSTRVGNAELFQRARRMGYEITNLQWARPLTSDPLTAGKCIERADCGTSRDIAARIINIPVHYYVTDEALEGMIALLRNQPSVRGGSDAEGNR